MNLPSLPWRLEMAWPPAAWPWPHWQRLTERWWRRWGYALAGWVLGLGVMFLVRPEVHEAHAAAEQAVTHWRQKMAAQAPAPAAHSSRTQTALLADAHHWLQPLPPWAPEEVLWADWQRVLAARGLRLQHLQPLPSGATAATPAGDPDKAPGGVDGPQRGLASHLASLRVVGRFDDWAHLWTACAETGQVCAVDRIHVVPTEQHDEVQIDMVMRLWTRPAHVDKSDMPLAALSQSQSHAHPQNLGPWATALMTFPPPERWRQALFVPAQSGAAAGPSARGGTSAVPGLPPLGPVPASTALVEVESDDPRQWPFAQVRLVGLWRQGDDRHAVLAAGQQAVRVELGQRVSSEGHRVVAITDQGVRLRSGQGPVFLLTWSDAGPDGPPHVKPSRPSPTTGSQPP